MSDYKPADGDRVRVVYEGVVNSADDTGFAFDGKVPVIYDEDKDYLVSVEKIEPPVEVFKPGDVIRHKSGVWILALAERGYTYVEDRSGIDRGRFFLYRNGFREKYLTSNRYEKVNLSS